MSTMLYRHTAEPLKMLLRGDTERAQRHATQNTPDSEDSKENNARYDGASPQTGYSVCRSRKYSSILKDNKHDSETLLYTYVDVTLATVNITNYLIGVLANISV